MKLIADLEQTLDQHWELEIKNMENNEKSEYFAQYLNQKVLFISGALIPSRLNKLIPSMLVVAIDDMNGYYKTHIELKPLSEITDEDAIEVARLYWNNAKPGDVNHTKKVLDTLIQKTNVADYVRSKGYALPFRNYSVDQLIEMGWLKLTTK